MKHCKFKVGDSVSFKKIGYPGVGEIIGFITGFGYGFIADGMTKDEQLWDILYPGWEKKNVFTVLFGAPRKTHSLEDIALIETESNPFEINEIYEDLPEVMVADYPEDDLELFETRKEKRDYLEKVYGYKFDD